MMILPNNSSAPYQTMMNNYASTTNLPPHHQPQSQQNITTTMNNPWVITAQEHQANEGQFIILRPIAGMIGGEQARPFFLKSGLPATILAQIWQLADLNKDGKLDRLEFSIAMKLVKNCLAGLPLPPTLPESMRQITGISPNPLGQFNGGGPPPASAPLPQMPPRPMSTYGTMPAMSSAYRQPPPYGGSYSAAQTPTHTGTHLPFQMGTKELGDWTLPQPMKLHFSQQFNQLDRSRVGLLTGQQARGVLGESQLPTQLLAQIWNMSDVNKDGCLSIEEFCTAQFLIEMVKAGYALPPKLPNELNAFCHRSRTVSPSTVTPTPTDPNAPPPQKGGSHFKTFEDKRKDNLDRGQAELERRRQILREEEERRRAEIERREREEADRKERERQELERRREAQMEAERQRQMERERERAVVEEKMKAQRDEARRRLEQERIKELEKIRIKDLENHLQAETEKTTQIQQRQRTMAFQLQALDERSQQLNVDISGSRDKILEITKEIEGMRERRDEKCAKIQELERKTKELNVQSERISHENLQLQSECQRQLSRTHEIEALRNEVIEIDEQIKRIETEAAATGEKAMNQEKAVIEKRPDWEKSCEHFKEAEKSHQDILDQYNQKRREIHPNAFIPPTPPTAAIAAQPKYEMPPMSDAAASMFQTLERQTSKESHAINASSGFGSDFKADFAAAFVSGAGTQPEKQKSIDDEQQQYNNRRRSTGSGGSVGSVAAIAAKLQQQLQFQHPNQKQPASLSREESVTSQGKPPVFPSSASIEGLQLQQQNSAQSITATLKPVKYRALYEFNARSADELTLQPGDVILVFEGHQSEPGWLAGQIRDKVGWFPAAFAEPFASTGQPATTTTTTTALKKGGSLTGSPSTEPLAIIQEEGEMPQQQIAGGTATAPFVADFATAFAKSSSMTDTSFIGNSSASSVPSATITASRSAGASFNPSSISSSAATPGALYDLPPSDDQNAKHAAAMSMSVAQKQTNSAVANAPPLYEMPPGETANNGEPILGTGIALYQWKARNDQEMSFARGDIIEVLEHGEMRWRGRLQKNRQTKGWFPKSYIKMNATITPAGIGTAASTQQIADEKLGPSLVNGKGGNRHTEEIKQMTQSNGGQQRKGSQSGEGGGELFIALYQFDAVEPTDLSLKPGDRICVLDQKDQWWRGTCEGRMGIFPANYVQKATEIASAANSDGAVPNVESAPIVDKSMIGRAIATFEATASNQISLSIGDIVRVHQMTPGGWWEGELERDGKKHFGWFPGNYIQMSQASQSGKLLAIAAFDYQAQHEDELSFKAGDIIEIVDRPDDQWWRGRRQSADAIQQPPLLFPANFVQLR